MKFGIVGAGISGASAAYFLSKEGHEVVVFEKKRTFGGNVLKSSALVWHIRDPPLDETWSVKEACTHLTHQLVQEIAHEWGDEIKLAEMPTLSVIHNQEELAKAKRDVENLETARIISLEEGRKLCPHFADHLPGFVLWPKSYAADPFLTMKAVVRRAEAQGAKFRYAQEVVQISKEGRLCTRPVPDTGGKAKHQFDRIVVTGGSDISRLLHDLGVHCPVFPVQGQMFTLKPPPGFRLNCIISSWEKDTIVPKIGGLHVTHMYHGAKRRFRHLYGRQRSGRSGQLIFGGDRMIGKPGYPYPQGHESVHSHVSEIFPKLANCNIRHEWFGDMPWTPDEKPVIGPVCENVFVVGGLCACGFGYGVGAAQLLIEDILNIRQHRILNKVDPLRFDLKTNLVAAKL